MARADRASRLSRRRFAIPWARRWRPRCCWRRPSSSRASCRCSCRATARCISAGAMHQRPRRPRTGALPGGGQPCRVAPHGDRSDRRSDRHRQSDRDAGDRRRRAALSGNRAHRGRDAWPNRCRSTSKIPSSCRRGFGCMPTRTAPRACCCKNCPVRRVAARAPAPMRRPSTMPGGGCS